MPAIPSLRRLKQGGCCEFMVQHGLYSEMQTSLGYQVSPSIMLALVTFLVTVIKYSDKAM